MDTESLGMELAKLIGDTVVQSVDDIQSTLVECTQNIVTEYVALLVWIVITEASIVISRKSVQQMFPVVFAGIFSFLGGAGVRRLVPDFNENILEDFLHNRFDLYNDVWGASPTTGDPLKDAQREHDGELSVAYNFIVCCFADEEEYINFFPNIKDTAAHSRRILHHYHQFSEKLKSVLSRC